MPSETLDTLYISFQASGAQEIFNTIKKIDDEISKLENKLAKSEEQILSRISKTREAFDKKITAAQKEFGQVAATNKKHLEDELGILKQIAVESEKIKNNIGTNAKLNFKTVINETGSHVNNTTRSSTTYRYGKGSNPFFDLLVPGVGSAPNSKSKTEEAIEKTAENTEKLAKSSGARGGETIRLTASIFALAKGTMAFNNQIIGEQKSLANWSTAKSLAGFSGNSAENAYVNIAQFGGGRMDAISSDRNISGSLGRLAYGDTSLIQSLGMFGIGGITPRSTPQEIRQKVIDRLKRGDLDLNRRNALLSALPYSDAEKMAMLNDIDVYKGDANTLNISEIGKNQITRDVKGDLNVENWKKAFNDSTLGESISNLISYLKKESPLVAALEKLTIPLETIATSWIIKRFLGGTGAKAAATSANSIISAIPSRATLLKGLGFGAMLMSPNTLGDAEHDRMVGYSEQLKNVDFGAWNFPPVGNTTNNNSNNTTTNNYNFYNNSENADVLDAERINSRILDNAEF